MRKESVKDRKFCPVCAIKGKHGRLCQREAVENDNAENGVPVIILKNELAFARYGVRSTLGNKNSVTTGLCDGNPMRQVDWLYELGKRAGLERPPVVGSWLCPVLCQRYGEDLLLASKRLPCSVLALCLSVLQQ